jgi:hypothetical protein
MYKIGVLRDGEWVEHSYAPTFTRSATSAPKAIAGVPHGDPVIFSRLVSCIEPPYFLLYVLHTPRGEADPGRYQSPPVSAEEFLSFVERFSAFLASDARFDLWVHSPSDKATVVWDRHNVLHAYGPVTAYERELRALGFSEGEVVALGDHCHHYHADLDEDAKALVAAFDWSATPLRDEDVQ